MMCFSRSHSNTLYLVNWGLVLGEVVELVGELLGGEVGHGVVGDDAAVGDDDGAGAYGLDLLHDVGGEEDRLVLADLTDEGADFLELVGVEAGGGLVEDEHVGVVDERLSEADALLVALGELGDALVGFGGEACHADHLLHPVAGIGDLIDAGGEGEELADIHLHVERVLLGEVADVGADREGVVVDALSANQHVALGGGDEAGDDLHEGGFAGAVGAEEADDFAFFGGEADVVEGALLAVVFGDLLNFEHILNWKSDNMGNDCRRGRG